MTLDKAEIGATGVFVTRIGMGGAPIGGLYTAVEAAAVGTIRQAHELGGGYLDTPCMAAAAARCCSAVCWTFSTGRGWTSFLQTLFPYLLIQHNRWYNYRGQARTN